ncbi:hypothetical protein FDF20_19095 [Acinetobacter baumannii]|nr:hypothetical protein FDF20_19095 [Acinetobacter baumannii]
MHIRSNAWVYKVFIYVKTLFFQPFYLIIYYEQLWFEMALLHKDLKVKTSHIYSNLSDNSGMWSA